MIKERILRIATALEIVVALIILVGLAGCNSNSPKATAEKFLNGFYHMEYDKAREVSTEKTKSLVDLVEQFSVASPDSVKKNAKKIAIDITDVKEEGDKATVTYKISSEPGDQKLDLVKVNGKWMADFSKENNMPAEEETPVVDTTSQPVMDDTAQVITQ